MLSSLSQDFSYSLLLYSQTESVAGDKHVMVRFVPTSLPALPLVGSPAPASGISVSLDSSSACSQQVPLYFFIFIKYVN